MSIVALAGAPDTDHLIRRAARIAQRAKGELIGVHVVSDTGLTSGRDEEEAAAVMAEQRQLLEELGGEYRKVTSNDVAAALVELARSENATQIVLGASNRSRWQELFGGSVINRVVRLSGPIDVHVISRPPSDEEGSGEGGRRLPHIEPVLTPLSPRRQLWGWVLVVVGLPLITLAFANLRDQVGFTSVLLLYLVLAMVVALVGGVLPAIVAVIGGFLLANWYFTPPFYELTIAEAENLLALVVYAVAAGIVAVLVDRVGRSRMRAARLQAEAEALASLAGALAGPGSVADMLGQLRATFGFRSAALLHGDGDRVDGGRAVRARAADPSGGRRRQPRPRARHRAGPRRRHADAPRTSVCSTPSPPRSRRRPSTNGCNARPAGPRTSLRPTRCGRRCCRPSPTTCAHRWRRSRRRSPACASATSTGRRTRSPSSRRRSRRRPTG